MRKGREQPKPEKISEVEELKKLIEKYPAVGVIDLYKMPAAALQSIRNELKGKAVIRVNKKSIAKFALEKVKDKGKLVDILGKQPALIFTEMNPFRLYKIVEKGKSSVAAKPGDIAPKDIIVRAGPTDLPPGPAITTLSKLKILAKVEGGKISVIKDTPVAKAGDRITEELASVLGMLKLKPIEVMLNVTGMWEGGTVYKKDVLAVDEAKFKSDITLASSRAMNLAMNAGWVTKETIRPMLMKAFMNAKELGVGAGIIDKGVIDELLAKAQAQATALKARTG
jgi:large subunit ribosomal protein L10